MSVSLGREEVEFVMEDSGVGEGPVIYAAAVGEPGKAAKITVSASSPDRVLKNTVFIHHFFTPLCHPILDVIHKWLSHTTLWTKDVRKQHLLPLTESDLALICLD